MSTKNNKIWYNANKEYDSWYKVVATMDNYQEWDDPPIILEETSKKMSFQKNILNPSFILTNVELKYGTFEANYYT